MSRIAKDPVKLLTTSKGILTDSQAIKNQVGGEIICRVF